MDQLRYSCPTRLRDELSAVFLFVDAMYAFCIVVRRETEDLPRRLGYVGHYPAGGNNEPVLIDDCFKSEEMDIERSWNMMDYSSTPLPSPKFLSAASATCATLQPEISV